MAGSKHPDRSSSAARAVSGHVDDWEELAIDYLDGSIDAMNKAAVEAHIDSCSSCAARLGVQRGVCNVLRLVALDDAPPRLEDETIGDILFPPELSRPLVPATSRSRWSTWRRRYKPWIPVTAAVVAFFAIMISVGVLRSGGLNEMAAITTTAGSGQSTSAARGEGDLAAAAPTTAAPGATVAATAAATESATADDGAVGAGAAGPTTTAVPAATYADPGQDKKTMVAQLQAASTPVYFVYQSIGTPPAAGPGETATALTEQITMLTGLKPVLGDLALDGATFAAFVLKKDATALVELLQSIGSSLELTLNLALEPIALPASQWKTNYGDTLRERKAELPELSAQRTPQPAVTKYSFTTSTVVADSGHLPPGWTAPDDAGTHVLVVIYLGE